MPRHGPSHRRKPRTKYQPRLEALESRRLLAYAAGLANNMATFTGDAAGDVLALGLDGQGQLTHNRFAAGDAGFESAADLDSLTPGVQAAAVAALTSIQVLAGGGDDEFQVDLTAMAAPAGGITFDGNTGTDRLTAAADVNLTLNNSRLTGSQGTINLLKKSVEQVNLVGGPSDNRFNATAFSLGPVALAGNAGNDTLQGGKKNDQLSGGAGNDFLSGGPGVDQLLEAVAGNVSLSNTQFLGLGKDTLVNVNAAELVGSDAADRIDASMFKGPVTLRGGGGDDVLLGGKSNDRLFGDAGNDRLTGNKGSDLLQGGDDNDWLTGNAGNDALQGDAGNDMCIGGEGNDTAAGAAGNDSMDGGIGVDRLNGGDDADLLFGGDGPGMRGGASFADQMTGGAGADNFGPLDPADVFSDFVQGTDTLATNFTAAHLRGTRTDLLPGAPNVNDRRHLTTPINYQALGYTNPPTYGPHSPVWLATGVYTVKKKDENLIHNLEHGHVVINYDPALIGTDLTALRNLARSFGSQAGILLAPRPNLGSAVALASWARLQLLNAFDEVAVRDFIFTNRGYGPEGYITP